MSSLLRVSKLIGRQRRVLQQQRILTNTSFQQRQFSWAPPAYRRQKPRSKRRHNAPKKFGKGRVGLWKHLQEVYGETSSTENKETTSYKTKEKKDDRLTKKFLRREQQLITARQEFRAVIHRYRNALFPESDSKKSRKGSLARLLRLLHQLCKSAAENEETVKVSMDTIVSTEDQFRDLGKLTRQLISLLSRLPDDSDENGDDENVKNSVMAEDLLRALIQLKEDRARLVQRANEARKQQEADDEKQEIGWVDWFKGLFLLSPGEEPQEEEETRDEEPKLMAHEEPTFGPTKSQYGRVIKSIRYEAAPFKWESSGKSFHDIRAESKDAREGLLACANRMSSLLDLHLEKGGEPATSLTSPTMELYSQVGSLEAANEARRIYSDINGKRVPRQIFHWVLRAYRLAALMEELPAARAEAATTAMALLEEREQYSLATSDYSAPDSSDPRGESYSLVLEALQNAGQKALPERISQAETLLKLYLGEALFNQVVNYRKDSPPSEVDMQVFESLLLMYASQGGEYKLVKMAKNILQCAEDQQAAITDPDSTSDTENERPVFPNTKSYNAVLMAIQMKIKRIMIKMLGTKNVSEKKHARQIIQDEVTNATAFLDRMPEACPPDLETFERLLETWAMVELPESQDRADEILSRMSIRQACAGNSNGAWSGSSRGFSHLLHCWASGPDASSSAALQRALRIVDKMEAQGGILHLPPPDASEEEREIFESVYEQNEPLSYTAAYNGALKICSLCLDDPKEAFEAAFDIYNRMIAAGVKPDQETFTNLFATCLVPGEDQAATEHRQELASTVIAFASDYGMNTSLMAKQLRTFKAGNKKGKVRRDS